jgi:TIR domain
VIKITHNGRPFDPKRFAEEIQRAAIEVGMRAIEEKARGAASSIVDPETGRHADVFVDRLPGNRVSVRTTGSPSFASLLEKRLGVGVGEVALEKADDGVKHPKVYLAHASEDKAVVRPLAKQLVANGIDVWFDEWEIEPGESLRQKMEEGLLAMTHFVVVLTPNALTKPWVSMEIDVGMVQKVGGESHFVPLLVGVEPKELPPFLRTMLGVKIDPSDPNQVKELVDRLHGVSRKPALGPAPKYVQSAPSGLTGWSPAAIEIGRHFVTSSKHAMLRDPIKTLNELVAETGLSEDDVRIAVLDLKNAGYLWEANIRGHFAPECAMFTDFDEEFMPFSPKEDAVAAASRMMEGTERAFDTKPLAEELGWEPRRMNSAICYLQRAGAIRERHALAGGPWRAVQLIRTDETLRFVRNRA